MAGRRKKSTPKIVPKLEEMDRYTRIVEEQLQEGNIGGEVVISMEGENELQQRREEEDSNPEIIIKMENALSESDRSLSSSPPHIIVTDVRSYHDRENGTDASCDLPTDEPPSGIYSSKEFPSVTQGVGNRTRSKNQTLNNGRKLRDIKPVESPQRAKQRPKTFHVMRPPTRTVVKKPHACEKCDLSFTHKIELIHHGSAHADDKRFGCDQCGYRARRIDYLLTHIRSHSGERPFSCAYCPYSARDSSTLKAHELTHSDLEYESDLKAFSCMYCNYKTLKKRFLDTHLTKHTGERPFACPNCDYAASTKYGLEQHSKIHSGEKRYSCKKCDYKSITRNNLRHHVLKNHTENLPYVCDECDYQCSSATRLKDHQRAHRGEKPFHCDVCDFSSTVSNTLKTHMRIHTGEKPYPCAHCDYRAARYSTLRIHMKSRHSVKDERNLHCGLCEYRTKYSCDLKLHKMLHTGSKPFGCALCHYRTNKKTKLVPHLRRHYGWRPFKCKKCNWRFVEKSELKVHMRVHLKKTTNPDMSGVQHSRSYEDLKKHKAKLDKAVLDVQEGRLPLKTAARVHGVPFSTLYYRIHPKRLYPEGKKSVNTLENGSGKGDHSSKSSHLNLNPSTNIVSRKKAQSDSVCMVVDANDLNEDKDVKTSLATFVGAHDIMAAAAKLPEARVVLHNVLSKQASLDNAAIPLGSLLEDPTEIKPVIKDERIDLENDIKPPVTSTFHLPNAVSYRRPYVCKTCSFEATSGFELEEHRKFHLSLSCGLCDFRSREIDDLKMHVMSVHIM